MRSRSTAAAPRLTALPQSPQAPAEVRRPMSAALASRLSAWLARRHGRDHAPVRPTQRRIFILPSRSGALLGLTLGLMLLGCINYNLGLGYVLTFLLAGVATVALLHTFRNLA